MNRHNRVSAVIRIVNIVLGLGLGVGAVFVCWFVFFAQEASFKTEPPAKNAVAVNLSEAQKEPGTLRSLMVSSGRLPENGSIRPAAEAGRLRLCGLARGGKRAWAVLEDTASRTQIIASVGDRVFGYELKAVEENKVVLSKDGARTELVIRSVPAHKTVSKDAAAVKENPPLEKSRNSFDVERAQIDLAFSDLALIRKTARIIPFYRSGASAGFLVFDIRADSPLLEIGLKNGDIVTHINGRLLTSAMGPAELFSMLSSRDNVNLLVSRNSSTVNLCYRIR